MSQRSVRVFVDDYVTGRLPSVCAVTGHPTTDQVKLKSEVRSANPAWLLLIFLGPVGWVALLLIAANSREFVTGWLPYSHEEWKRRRRVNQSMLVATALGVGGSLLLAVVLSVEILYLIALLVTLMGLGALYVVRGREPRFELDASRRWLSIGNVHEDFAAAFETHQIDV